MIFKSHLCPSYVKRFSKYIVVSFTIFLLKITLPSESPRWWKKSRLSLGFFILMLILICTTIQLMVFHVFQCSYICPIVVQCFSHYMHVLFKCSYMSFILCKLSPYFFFCVLWCLQTPVCVYYLSLVLWVHCMVFVQVVTWHGLEDQAISWLITLIG